MKNSICLTKTYNTEMKRMLKKSIKMVNVAVYKIKI